MESWPINFSTQLLLGERGGRRGTGRIDASVSPPLRSDTKERRRRENKSVPKGTGQ